MNLIPKWLRTSGILGESLPNVTTPETGTEWDLRDVAVLPEPDFRLIGDTFAGKGEQNRDHARWHRAHPGRSCSFVLSPEQSKALWMRIQREIECSCPCVCCLERHGRVA